MDGGYIEGSTYYFFITDHLGSNRVVANTSGTAIQNTHYYPFGTAFAESTGQEKQPYKYNGKELDLTHGLNLYDYSARYMDSPIGRFTSVDPLAEKYYSWSPYSYCKNNPILRIDPTGMYDIIGMEKDKSYGVVVVISEKMNSADKRDFEVAKEAGIPVMTVKDIDDFALGMTQIASEGVSTTSYSISSHGSPGKFEIGETSISSKTDFTSLKDGLDGKNVFINACNLTMKGDVGGKNLIENFSTQTNSIVVSSDHAIAAGFSFDGGKGLYVDQLGTDARSLSPTLNDFHMAKPGESAKSVYDFSINRDGTFVWKDIDKYK